MGPHWIMLMSAAAGGGLCGAAAWSIGAAGQLTGLAALLGATSAASLAAAVASARARASADARFDTLAQEMVLIRQRQIEADAKLEDVSRRSQESPALVWRAATSDIQVLGTLVSDLAKSVAEHEEKLAAVTQEQPAPEPAEPVLQADPVAAVMLPDTSPPPPSWFEDDLELAADDPEPEEVAPAPSPAVMAELRATLAEALTSERVEICLQPYVTLPQRKIAGYEASLALKAGDGVTRDLDGLRRAARASGMAAELDKLLVERAGQVLRVLRARERSVAMTCAISGASLTDPDFRSAVEAVARAEGKLAQNLLLSFPLDDVAALLRDGRAALQSLVRSGVSLGVHGASAAGIDAAALERLGARELRLPAGAIIGADGAASDIHPADLNELMERRGIRMLVTGIDDEATMRDLLDCSATFGQGALFGASRPVRPEVLQPKAVGDAPARAPARLATEAPQPRRQSFRSVLRRA
jgi:cyclic-di-GMP phosphodiesterase, flagellum assembly factor TipF